MKFQKLTIHNIASIEDAVIDFESKPLADSEVFLITGKTGAGKSTILDAICLALYADTPRLDGTRMQGETRDCDKTVKIDDPRQLMRRNTAEASVSLTFTGNDGIHYEATWTVARARKKAGGNIQPKDWQLKNLDTGSICTKDKETEAGIKAATGLDFSQFCRTTMLAQGEFTRFLDSRDEDKAEILEKITGADIYSKIGARIYEITGQKKLVRDDAVRLINDTRTFSEDEIKVRKDEIERLDKEYGRLKAESDRKSVILQWLRTEEKFRKEIADAAEVYRLASEALESEDFRNKSDLVRIWEVTADARRWYSQMLKSESERKRLKEEFIPLSEDFGRLLGGQVFIRQQTGMLGTAVRDIDAFLEKEKDNAAVYENAQTVIGHLKTMAECRTAIAGNLKTIAEEKDALEKTYIPGLEKAKAAEQEAKGILEREEKEINLMADAVTALNLPGLRSRRDAAKETIAKAAIAKERIGMLSKEKRRMEELARSLAGRMEAIVEKEKKIASMAAGIHDAELERNIRRQDLDKLKDSVDDFAIAIRQKLQIGDTCPVCMQKIKSAIPHEEELQALTGGLRAAFEEAESCYSGLVMERQKLEAEVKAEKDEYERARTSYEQDHSVPEAMEKALLACRECGINDLDGSTLTSLEKIGKDAEADIAMLDIAINDGTIKETAVRERQKALSVNRRDTEALSTKVQEAELKVTSCRNRLATTEALVKSRQDDMLKAANAVHLLLTGTPWDTGQMTAPSERTSVTDWKHVPSQTASATNWQESPLQTAEALQSAATEYFRKVQDRQRFEKEYESAVSVCRNLENIIGSILRTAPKWQEIMPSGSEYMPDILKKANDLNTSLTSLATRYRTATDAIKENRALLESFLAGSPDITIEKIEKLSVTPSDSIKTASGYINDLVNNASTKKALLEESLKRHGKHLQDKPETDENDTAESLEKHIAETGTALSAISEKKGALNLELETDALNRKRLGDLIADADRKNAEYQKWSRMNQLLGDATGNKFRKIAQSYVLSSLIHSANGYMKSLTDRYTLKVTPGTFVISLEDAYQGFASRAASTISGGESFLVSLSLALALSDIGQNISADTLFIDEGFGTLSGEPLQNAIATLRSLHTKAGRHVGIISHVEELRERIPVQIQVLQDGNNSSSTVRIVPENVNPN